MPCRSKRPVRRFASARAERSSSRPVLSLIDARTHYDITRDGKRLLVRQPAGPQEAGLTVILNWMAKLK